MKKPVLTEQQLADKAAVTNRKRQRTSLKTQIVTEIKNIGLTRFQYKLDFLKNNPNTKLPNELFDHAETVSIFEEAIATYNEKYAAKFRYAPRK